ncbi:DUF1302 domain-containing protein [Limnohabitans sp.]|uniref:DUF1302 domain-containing protein n=1 Tax=Limnohabitans sp. TaxID=1907725 RepID=UPI0025BF1302|nr:DUF1302 domain-containing protein [Limnohabitans sp.]
MQSKNKFAPTKLAWVCAALTASMSPMAHAVKFEMDNGITGSFDSTLSFGMQKRLKSPNTRMIGNDSGGNAPTSGALGGLVNGDEATANPDMNFTNSDDGNLNYRKGSVVSSVVKGTHELSLREEGNWSMLGRFTWSSDLSARKTIRSPLDDEAANVLKKDITLLDLWVAKELDLGGNSAKLKLGNQVISWGEDIFILGGINSINALDLRKYHIPGTQLKEIFIPAPMASLSTSLGKGFSTEAYYQFAWNGMKLDPAGTFWSTADFVGAGGKRGGYLPTSSGLGGGDFDPTRGRDMASVDTGRVPIETQKPQKGGQYGINLRYKPAASDSEFAAYYMRYHDKMPFIGYKSNGLGTPNAIGLSGLEQYGENLDLFGISMNTKMGDWALGAELSYRPKDSVAIDPTVPFSGKHSLYEKSNGFTTAAVSNGYVSEKKYQIQATAFRFLPTELTRALGAAEGYVMAEVAYTKYPHLDLSGAVPYYITDYSMPTKGSWGYVAEIGLTYPNFMNTGWTMSPVADFFHDVRGTSPNAIPFVEGRRAVALMLNFDYQNKVKAAIGYTTFFGGGTKNLMSDRDVMSLTMSYSF